MYSIIKYGYDYKQINNHIDGKWIKLIYSKLLKYPNLFYLIYFELEAFLIDSWFYIKVITLYFEL